MLETVEGYRLSPQQRRLWVAEQEGDARGVAQCVVGIAGDVQPARLRDALRSLVRRHESLRTHFRRSPGMKVPLQVVSDQGEPAWREVELSSSSAATGAAGEEGAWSEIRDQERSQPFDLERGALLRAVLAEMADGSRRLLLSMPALAVDGASLRNLFEDLCRALDGQTGDDDPVQHLQFSEWHNDLLSGEGAAEGEAFWRSRLAGFQDVGALLEESAGPSGGAGLHARVSFTFAAGVAERVAAVAERHGGSPAGFLFAVWHALLARLTADGPITTAFLGPRRKFEELEEVVGPLALPVPVTSKPDADTPSFLALWKGLEGELREAAAWQESYPVEGAEAGPSIGFELLGMPPSRRAGAGRLTLVDVEVPVPGLRLQLACRLGLESLDGVFTYSGERFSSGSIERLAERYETLVHAALARPEEPLDSLDLLGPRELGELLAEAAGAREDFAPTTVDRLLIEAMARHPESIAVFDDGGALTCGELLQRSHRLAHHLRGLGVGTDDLVALCLPRSSELLVTLLAILETGAAFLPLDPGYPRQRLERMLDDSRARLLVTRSELHERLLASHRTPPLFLDRQAAALDRLPATPLPSRADPDALAYVIYTSGSTGGPKGTLITHRGLANYLRWGAAYYRAAEGSGAPLHSPVGFDLTITTLFLPLLCGTPVHLVPEGEGMEGLARALRAQPGFSFVKLTPAHLEILGDLLPPDQVGGATGALILGGEALRYRPLELWRRHAPATRLINEYGPTETVVGCCVHEVEAGEAEAGTVPIGRPIANTEIYLLDAPGRPVPRGAVGEVFIGGAGVARGYLGRPELTAERFVPDPFGPVPGARLYRTGDLARSLASGGLEFLGRNDSQVKVRGFRVELGEIEGLLGEHPAIREAAVVVKDDPSGRRLVAFYVAEPGSAPPAGAELRSYLQARLPEPVVPSAFAPLAALALTPNGKVDRAALLALEEEGAGAQVRRAPREQVERLLADLWSQLLGREVTSVGESFFELGGHSLVAMQLVARVRNTFEVEISINDFLEAPTLAGLAQRVEAALQAGGGIARPPLEPVGRSIDLPLSFAQERLWLLDQLQPGNVAYNVPAVFSFAGELDVRALEASYQEILRRHEALRTVFRRVEDGPVQEILPFSALSDVGFDRVDLGALPEELRREKIAELTASWARSPFDLARGPLVRALLVQMGGGEMRLLLTLHHIVCDAWSMEVLIGEWSALYQAFSRGQASPLPPLPVQYADYAVWQRSWLQGETLEGLLSFWRQRLEGEPPVLDLPTPLPRPPVQSYRGAKRSATLAAAVAEGLHALARRERVTPFMALLAAYELLLFRYSGQERFLVGSPIAGRGDLKLEGLIGFFINTLVLRADLRGEPDFLALLGRVRRDALSAFAHPDLPFEKLLEALPQERDRSRPPLFQVVFSMQTPPALPSFLTPGAEAASGLSLAALETGTGTSKVDLNLEMTLGPLGITANLEYNTDLFDAAAAARLLDHFETLLASAVEAPERRLTELPILREGERRQILSGWSTGAALAPPAFTLHRLFELQAARAPESPAAVYGDETLTYGQLNRRANRFARHLGTLGVGAEVLVGLCLERSLELVVAILAVLKAGAAYVPLDPSYPMERLGLILDDAGIPVLLTHDRAGDNLPSHWAFVVDVDRTEGRIAGLDDTDLDLPVEPDHLAYAIYTSGSTGRPKGVLVPHAGLASLACAQAAAFGVEPGSRVLQFASLSFDASASELGMAFAAGAALVLGDRDDLMPGPDLVRLFARQRISHVTLPPSSLAVLDEASEVPTTLIVAGEASSPELVARWAPGRRLFNAYGPTEVTVCATLTAVEPGAGRPPIGVPLANARVYLLDRSFGLVPAGVPGEICVGGIGVARGYLRRPDATALAFVPDPYGETRGGRLYRTGDLGRFLPDGRIEFLGRSDEQVKIRGFRIEPGEVEAALSQHPEVEHCVVVPWEDDSGARRLVAYFVPRREAAPEDDELREFLKAALPAHLVPAQFVPLPSLPLLPNGKVDRRGLPDPDPDGRRQRDGSVAPRSWVEEILAGLWSEVLGVEVRGVDDNFFDLGGYSLAATQVLSRVRDVFGVEVSLGSLFARPTLGALAQEVEAAPRDGSSLPPPVLAAGDLSAEVGEAPLSYSQELMWRLEREEGGARFTAAPSAFRIRGELDPAALEGALREVLRRHSILRSTYRVAEGRPVQVVGPVPERVLPLVDLSSRAEGEPTWSDLVASEARRPFDLGAGPVLRSLLIRCGERDHVLLLVGHHIAFDRWSAAIFLRELAVLYGALRGGGTSPLPEPVLQYADFARWQRAWMAGEVLAAELDYWRGRLAGAKPASLPAGTDRRRIDTAALLLAPERVAALAALGRRRGATLFMTLLAVYQLVLLELTDEPDLLVASAIANRNRSEIEGLIGFFANTLVLRGDLRGDPAFSELLVRVRSGALADARHQDLPIERLAAELELSRQDLFRIGFNFLDFAAVPVPLSGAVEASVEAVAAEGPEMLSDLLLVATLGVDGLLCRFQVRGGAGAADPERLAARFDRMAREVVANPERSLSSLLASDLEAHD